MMSGGLAVLLRDLPWFGPVFPVESGLPAPGRPTRERLKFKAAGDWIIFTCFTLSFCKSLKSNQTIAFPLCEGCVFHPEAAQNNT